MKRYNFDRTGMAQGIGVHADTLEEAYEKAYEMQLRLIKKGEFYYKRPLVFRDNQMCLPGYCKICDKLRKEV